jgi:hypothetical protein
VEIMGAPVEAPGGGDQFTLSSDERDCLVRHAVSVTETAGEEAAGGPAKGELFRDAAKHTTVMVALLEQLGWSAERSIPGSYTLYEELLPIEQVRVWVSERFRREDEAVIDDAVRNLRDGLDEDLRAFGVTCRLLSRLNAHADERRAREGTREHAEISAPIDAAEAAAVQAPYGRTPEQVAALAAGRGS